MPRPSTLVLLFSVLFPALAFGAPRASKRGAAGPAVSSDLQLQPQVTPAGMTDPPVKADRVSDGENSEPRRDARAPAVRPPKLGDAELRDLWTRWRTALAEGATAKAEEAAKALLAAKDELGIADLEAFSVAVSRQAARRYGAGEAVEAVELSRLAVD
ncbi:MAG TPA: hypothetical protein VE618_08490, partial [Myxococcaceae bacterium]|nr:hypothetical protein [Myxococcaceae bacterium]